MKKKAYRDNAPPILLEYLHYLSVIKGRAENTVLSYYEDLKLFFRFLNERMGVEGGFENDDIRHITDAVVESVTLMDAMEFLHFMNDRGNNAASRSRRAIALRRFYKYLADTKRWYEVSPLDKLTLPSAKRALPKYLTLEQSKSLLNIPNAANTFEEARAFCMLTLFLNCGMRLSELVSINTNDVRRSSADSDNIAEFLVIRGKGSKERSVYLNKACAEAIENYIEHRTKLSETHEKLLSEQALFVSERRCQRLSPRRVQQIVEESLAHSGLSGNGISVHKLRHTAATLMYQNGVDVLVLKDVLGHENLGTTQIYTHVADKRVKEAMKQNPLSGESVPGEDNNKK
ncbi:MAG: tyrosine-type recombinase/integrase [Oscillospiraceae bacterium]|jgi:site-specific recombinase XerD|nr:tyrosine-type recombinase/integrase [Oscillospiraceae bacterium]